MGATGAKSAKGAGGAMGASGAKSAVPGCSGAVVLEVLRCMTGLNLGASRLVRFNLNCARPDFGITPQRFHYGGIAFGFFGMPGTGIVLFENRMMNYGRGHWAVGNDSKLKP